MRPATYKDLCIDANDARLLDDGDARLSGLADPEGNEFCVPPR